jgi:transcriptional regulator GlxA family with amidase domain
MTHTEIPLYVGVLVFNEVEVLDFTGPFEVFSLATSLDNKKLFTVSTIGETGEMISARNRLKVLPSLKFSDNPIFDILIIPGGYGAEEIEIKNIALLNWIKSQKVRILASVCTGALLLAECGLLDGKNATTHWMDIERLEKEYPAINVKRNVKYVDEGDIITSGGISAGINMSFHIIRRLFGTEIAKLTAKRMEYDIDLRIMPATNIGLATSGGNE